MIINKANYVASELLEIITQIDPSIVGASYICERGQELVQVRYSSGTAIVVNVTGDNLSALALDVAKAIS